MKFFSSLWVLADNDAMDVTQIKPEAEANQASTTPTATQSDYSNVINLLDYLAIKNQTFKKVEIF